MKGLIDMLQGVATTEKALSVNFLNKCSQLNFRVMHMLINYLFIFLMIATAEKKMNLDNANTNLSIYGTSSLHDWEITAEKCTGTAEVVFNDDNTYTINQLTFRAAVDALESGKSAMNSNTVKALEGDDHPYITYELTDIIPLRTTANAKIFAANGRLTIAGNTRTVKMEVVVTKEQSTLLISGEITLKMTDYKVDPPTAMFGTITTGNEITIKFNAKYI